MGIDIAADRQEQRTKETTAKKQQEKTRAKMARLNARYDTAAEKALPGYVCTQCGKRSRPISITKGSFLLEVLLWLLFIVPGIIYSVIRLSSRFKGCPHCRTQTMIAVDSPMGKKLIDQ